jgi:DNA-binding protein HU-beta
MGYEIHIEREGFDDGADPKGTITTNQWLAAVNAVEGVRISPEKDWVSRNPQTGSVIRVPGSGADAEVYFPPKPLKGKLKGVWQKVFAWDPRGKIRFRAHPDLRDPKFPVRIAAAALARHLGAIIVGDEGERFDWAGETPQSSSKPTKHTGTTGSTWPKDFIRYYSQSAGVPLEDAARLLQCFETCIIDLLKRDEVVTTGLGKFQLVKRREMSGPNPRTGETITIAAKNTLRFTPSQALTNKLQVKT